MPTRKIHPRTGDDNEDSLGCCVSHMGCVERWSRVEIAPHPVPWVLFAWLAQGSEPFYQSSCLPSSPSLPRGPPHGSPPLDPAILCGDTSVPLSAAKGRRLTPCSLLSHPQVRCVACDNCLRFRNEHRDNEGKKEGKEGESGSGFPGLRWPPCWLRNPTALSLHLDPPKQLLAVGMGELRVV